MGELRPFKAPRVPKKDQWSRESEGNDSVRRGGGNGACHDGGLDVAIHRKAELVLHDFKSSCRNHSAFLELLRQKAAALQEMKTAHSVGDKSESEERQKRKRQVPNKAFCSDESAVNEKIGVGGILFVDVYSEGGAQQDVEGISRRNRKPREYAPKGQLLAAEQQPEQQGSKRNDIVNTKIVGGDDSAGFFRVGHRLLMFFNHGKKHKVVHKEGHCDGVCHGILQKGITHRKIEAAVRRKERAQDAELINQYCYIAEVRVI